MNVARAMSSGVCLIAIAVAMAGCQTIDPVEQRAATVNLSIAEYANKSILLNLLRAEDRAPLSFAALTQFQGHNTLSGTLGLPSITLGPHLHTSPRAFTIGPNSATRSASNDFTINVTDDPNTYAALFSPISLGTLGVFVEQGYPREDLFLLFIDHIKVKEQGKGRWLSYSNDPEAHSHPQFVSILYDLLALGLTVRNNSTLQVQDSRASADSDLCFDKASEFNIESDAGTPTRGDLLKDFQAGEPAALDNVWTKLAGQQSDCNATPLPAPKTAANSSLELRLEIPTTSDPNAKPDEVTGMAVARTDGKPQVKSNASGAKPLILPDSTEITISFRSAYGAYLYLGELLGGRNETKYRIPTYSVVNRRGIIYPTDMTLQSAPLHEADKYAFFQVEAINPQEADKSCFVSERYGEKTWCVPEGAKNTKIVFSVLHQLVQLYSAPVSQSTNTITTRPAG